jgi:uncharacterized protein YjbJ (UPF0337 family)
MSTPSDSTVKGKFNEAVGSVKQTVGEAIGNEKLANEGAADQVKGQGQQAWGSVKEGAADLKAQHEAKGHAEAHDVREKVVSRSFEDLKSKRKLRPAWRGPLCFGGRPGPSGALALAAHWP